MSNKKEVKPYKVKHKPTGLYYQPHKHNGSNLSIRGKIYQTSVHGLSEAFNRASRYPNNEHAKLFSVFVEKGSRLHKMLSHLAWQTVSYSSSQLKYYTNVSDWIIEELKL